MWRFAQKCPESVIISLSIPIPQDQRVLSAKRRYKAIGLRWPGFEPAEISVKQEQSLSIFGQPEADLSFTKLISKTPLGNFNRNSMMAVDIIIL